MSNKSPKVSNDEPPEVTLAAVRAALGQLFSSPPGSVERSEAWRWIGDFMDEPYPVPAPGASNPLSSHNGEISSPA